MNEDRHTIEELKSAIEAILFVSAKPVTKNTIQKVLSINGNAELLDRALQDLITEYNNAQRGIFIREVAGGYQVASREQYGDVIKRLFAENRKRNLSRHALETLAVIAYKQPITLAEISEIRGKNAVYAVKSLLEKNLIRISGRKNIIGRPFLYSTTSEFLIRFGLNNLSELPKISELSEYIEETNENKDDTTSESTG